MNGLIDQALTDRLSTIIGMFFNLNRQWDSGMQELGVTYVMSNFVKAFHHNTAHAYPLMADLVSDLANSYNTKVRYPATPEGKYDYKTPLDFFEFNIELHLDIETYIAETREYAQMLAETNTTESKGVCLAIASAMTKLQRNLIPYIEQSILLRDKSEQYGQEKFNIAMFDDGIDKLVVVQEPEEQLKPINRA